MWEVKDYLASHPKAAVVNLGCGLDDTGRRADNGECRIYNLDFPDVINVRNELLPAGERETNIDCDLNDTAWFEKIDASVDPENEHLIQSALSELTAGKTIVTIAHRLATVQQADQILVVDDGRIADAGTHAELVKKDGVYKRFTEIREKAEDWRLEG